MYPWLCAGSRVCLQLKQRISDVNKAMQFGIEPEAELDDLLELHAKLVLLLAPSSDAIEAAGDSETHDMDCKPPPSTHMPRHSPMLLLPISYTPPSSSHGTSVGQGGPD